MSEFKGTKGEWRNNDLSILSDANKMIAGCYLMNFDHDVRGSRIPDLEGVANAKLISCAPEYHTELVDLVWLIESGATIEELQERIVQSKQLIKKATEL